MMQNTVEVAVEDLKRIFLLLGEVNHFFHQPLHFKDEAYIMKIAEKLYPEIKDLYYGTVWNILPSAVQEELQNK